MRFPAHSTGRSRGVVQRPAYPTSPEMLPPAAQVHFVEPTSHLQSQHFPVSTTPHSLVSGPENDRTSTQRLAARSSHSQSANRTPHLTWSAKAAQTSRAAHLSHVRRNARVHPKAAIQSWLSLLLALTLIVLRIYNFRTASATIDRQVVLPSLQSRASRPDISLASEQLTLHIFAVPKPFLGSDAVNQLRALESWLVLAPTPVITLLGSAPGVSTVAQQYGVRHYSRLDTTFLGLPLLPSLLATIDTTVKSTTSSGNIIVLLNADIVLFDDMVQTLTKLVFDNNFGEFEDTETINQHQHINKTATKYPKPWLAVAARWDVPSLPSLPVRGAHGSIDSRTLREAVVHVRTEGTLHTFGGIDMWAWPCRRSSSPSKTSLFPVPFPPDDIPPFAFGRGRYDNWLTNYAIEHDTHQIFDVSEAMTATHVSHDHHLVSGVGNTALQKGNEFWSSAARTKFELVVNAHLAETHGSYTPQSGTVLHAPYKLSSCYETQALCKFHRPRPHVCRCEYSPFVSRAQNDPYIVSESNVVFCGMLSEIVGHERKRESLGISEKWLLSGRIFSDIENGGSSSDRPFGLPLTQHDVLTVVANHSQSDTVATVVADYSERALLMETACSARVAGMFPWLVVVALDDNLYRFAAERGMAVYLAEYDDSSFSEQSNFRDAARLQTVIELLSLRKRVFAIEPGFIFVSLLFQYVENEMYDADVAFLPPLSVVNVNTSKGSGEKDKSDSEVETAHSGAILIALPNERAIALVKAIVGELEHGTDRGGDALWKVGCGNIDTDRERGFEALALEDCQPIVNVSVHLLELNKFRPVEPAACVTCDSRIPPLAWFSASRATNTVALEEVKRDIVSAGVSQASIEMSRCLWR